jgi:hypothetical protein
MTFLIRYLKQNTLLYCDSVSTKGLQNTSSSSKIIACILVHKSQQTNHVSRSTVSEGINHNFIMLERNSEG